jgi:hypothetical protein
VSRVEAAAGIEFDPPAHPEADAATVSYVEWVRALSVDALGGGIYRVRVGMRRLVAIDGVTYSRLPVEEVQLSLSLGANDRPVLLVMPVLRSVDASDPDVSIAVSASSHGSAGIGWPSDGG